MNWQHLVSISQLEELIYKEEIFIIFKHSTRCPVSSMAKRNVEYDFSILPKEFPIYILDLIALRDISDFIASHWGVKHESPQLLVVKGKSCLYHASHQNIEIKEILSFIS
ncbi:bacillithiol system redox-active protein YtxJ [Sphingobacterium sp. UT-1RO-CII-1]|uniref:bacillithiol system redox-active protein YtxJ n=1 Tax=Sphingobacterium sp. UT-1RO-CII-1 TaxID=2995225 RepID=UPI00227AF1A1|nr:bacillithiol system redox-active protein YtxJ [Sphingobacterium sp. UT-1RO-CII-1]MCY4780990.1 bacillithiol system redox-active protein YtxJ [Sphingobacterium sp. UT-1RO-CII-1]